MTDQEISTTEQNTNITTEIIQLIYYDLSYNENFEHQIQKTSFASLGKDYNTVAIIGCQSSGKSTLLNNLFQTNFEVMSDDKGRGQTTKGIWTSQCVRNKILILDCEGTDSKERGDDRHKFENCSSLFALAMADLLIVNMWTTDIGRWTASNYGVLKTVFEMNLKLFQQECAKKILFVLRDFNSDIDNKEITQKLILQDVYKIWEDVKKPEKYKDYEPQEFFEFEFVTIPHYFYKINGFNEQVALLRSRFSKDNDGYLFSHSSQEKNVLAQDLNMFCSKIWSTILNDKDLNIPNEKEMLARFKCNEIKNASLSAVEPKIENFVNDSDNREIPSADFVGSIKAILKEATDSYSSSAKYYLFHIYESVRTELTENIASKLYISFGNQAKKFIPKSQKEMRTELEEIVKNDDNFNKCSQSIKKKYLENLVNKLEKIKVFDSWEITEIEYEELFNEIIENQRRVCIQEKKTDTIKKLRRLIEDFIFVRMEDSTPYFWEEFNQEYFTMTYNMLFSLEAFFVEYYGMTNEEYKEIMVNIENEVYSSSKKDFLKKVMDLHLVAYDLFRKTFWYNEGVPRVWNKIEEQEITNLKDTYMKENEFIFNIFNQFKVLRNPLKYINYEKKSDAEFNDFLKTIRYLMQNESKYEELLSKNESSDLKKRYTNKVSELYEDALRRHANIVQQTMPIWIWIIIFYVGYEDVIRMFKGYWYIPVILTMSIYGTLKATGTTHIPGQIINIIKNFIKLQTGGFKI